MRNLQEIFNDCQYAISHVDDVLARKLLKEINLILRGDYEQINIQKKQELLSTQLRLKIVNMPNLSEEEAVDILQNHYLESFEAYVDMENRIIALLFFYPEIPRDELRRKLREALMRNQQILGGLTISQWIKEFEKIFPVKSRELSAHIRFSIEHPKALLLSTAEREKLKEILHVYDYLLVSTLPATGPVLNQILELGDLVKNNVNDTHYFNENKIKDNLGFKFTSNELSSNQSIKINLELISLLEGLKKYKDLGEQNITMNPLTLKFLPNSTRPSIKNWITDFHDNMGAGKHSAIDRGNYLFHSENGKKLTPVERRKLSILLKSLDENSPLTINPEKKIVVFDDMEKIQNAGSGSAQSSETIQHKTNDMFDGSRQISAARQTYSADQPARYRRSDPEPERRPIYAKNDFQEKDIFQKYSTNFSKETERPLSPDFSRIASADIQREEKSSEGTFASGKFFKSSAENKKSGPERTDIPQEGRPAGYFSNFASSEKKPLQQKPSAGTVAFSSPQKFPVEQSADEIKKDARRERMPQEKQPADKLSSNVISFPRSQKSQWQIKPRGFQENDSAKIAGNIVDLRN